MKYHYIQASIIYALSYKDSLRYSELKQDDWDSKLFSYHLQKVVADGAVVKRPDGQYMLTSKGRKIGFNVFQPDSFNQAFSVMFMAVQRPNDGAWLLGKRNTHPLKGRLGFVHAIPDAAEPITTTAQTELANKTGIKAVLRALGGGFTRFTEGEDIESFTNFTLLIADSVQGTLQQLDENCQYEWRINPDFGDEDFIKSTGLLHELALKEQPFHVDQIYRS